MGYVPYVGFVTHRRATVRIHLYFKRLMIKQMICIKKKKNGSSHGVFSFSESSLRVALRALPFACLRFLQSALMCPKPKHSKHLGPQKSFSLVSICSTLLGLP
jgi:hypothetical protein